MSEQDFLDFCQDERAKLAKAKFHKNDFARYNLLHAWRTFLLDCYWQLLAKRAGRLDTHFEQQYLLSPA